jgi:8-oxo-dGTP pyrophosphatase MutT (NUDIX family)
MPHIHELYDFVISVFIVHRKKVLLIHHKKYREWLPIGGHVELDEDPEKALYREIREECGLDVRILAEKPKIGHRGVWPLPTPSYMDVHRIGRGHKHIAFVYFGVASHGRAKLHEREHSEFHWFSKDELKEARPKLTRSIRFYCLQALKAAAGRAH